MKLCLLSAVVVACFCACSAPEPPAPPPPNIVLVVIDTFRPDHLGISGYHRQTAPFLEDVMARSTVFRRSYSTSSWTAPSTSSLFTGLYPAGHGVTEGFLAHRRRSQALDELVGTSISLNRLPAEVATLPELLREAGYATLGLSSNINIGSEIGFDRGFDRFRRLQDQSAVLLAREMRSWHAELADGQPTFTYLHFNDVHGPYDPRQPWYEPSPDALTDTLAAYDSEISYLDQVLSGLAQQLGWDSNTLLVVVSDHGEEFEERGRIGHFFSLYDELMRVLIVFSGADLGIPAQTLDFNVSLIDVAPTILDLAGVELPEDRAGQRLTPWLRPTPRDTSGTESRVLFGHRSLQRVQAGRPLKQNLWAVVRGPWKLIERQQSTQLFDTLEDPGEKRDLAAEYPEIVAELTAALDHHRSAGFRTSEKTAVELDQETLERLESLGYVH